MNLITTTPQSTMTSREIAELVESRHDSVKRAIDRLVASGVISQPPAVDGEKSANGVVESLYLIGKRDSYIIVAQLSPEFTARLVDRWQELEQSAAAATTALPKTLSQALRLAADQAEIIELQQGQLQIAAPKVDFVDRYVDTSGLLGFRQVCKHLTANEREFREFLEVHGVMYLLNGEWTAYAVHINAGRFVTRIALNTTNGKNVNTAMFTCKGLQWIAGVWMTRMLPLEKGSA